MNYEKLQFLSSQLFSETLSARNMALLNKNRFRNKLERDRRKKTTEVARVQKLVRDKQQKSVSMSPFLQDHEAIKMRSNSIKLLPLTKSETKLKTGTQLEPDGMNSRPTKATEFTTTLRIDKLQSDSEVKVLTRTLQEGKVTVVSEDGTRPDSTSTSSNKENKADVTPSRTLKGTAVNTEMKRTAVITDSAADGRARSQIEAGPDPETRPTTKRHSAFQTGRLRMREGPPERRVPQEEGRSRDSEDQTVDDRPLCEGLMHQAAAGLLLCKDTLEKSKPNTEFTNGLFKSRESQRVPDGDDPEYSHFYYFDGILKRVDPRNMEKRI